MDDELALWRSIFETGGKDEGVWNALSDLYEEKDGERALKALRTLRDGWHGFAEQPGTFFPQRLNETEWGWSFVLLGGKSHREADLTGQLFGDLLVMGPGNNLGLCSVRCESHGHIFTVTKHSLMMGHRRWCRVDNRFWSFFVPRECRDCLTLGREHEDAPGVVYDDPAVAFLDLFRAIHSLT